MPEDSSHHRLSMSSIDDTATDTEGGVSRPPKAAMARLADKFGSHRNNLSPIHDTIWTSQTDYAYDTRLLFKRKITNLYITLSSLKSYVEVNQSGFRKILKKYMFSYHFTYYHLNLRSLGMTRLRTPRLASHFFWPETLNQ